MSSRPAGLPLRAGALALLAAAVVTFSARPAPAAAPPGQPDAGPAALKVSAASKVPADAAFFVSSMRNKEQLELFTKSRAYKTLRKVPIVELAGKAVMSKLRDEDSPLKPLLDLYDSKEGKGEKDGGEESKEEKEQRKKAKENKELLDLILASAADEVFVYGGKGWTDLFVVLRQVAAAGLGGALNDPVGFDFVSAFRALGKDAILQGQKSREMIRVPDLVVGVKAKDAKKIEAHLKRIEPELKKAADQHPVLKDRLKREGGFLTLQLDGSLLPLDDIDTSDLVEKKDLKDLYDHLKKSTLAVSLGVKDGYLLLALTSSVKDLEKFGKPDSLAHRRELRPLARHADRKLTAVAYLSKDLLDASIGLPDWDATGKAAKKLVEKGGAKDELKKGVNKDIDGLVAELKKWKTGWGAMAFCGMLTAEGYEAFLYDHAKCDHLKGVNTRLLEHAGGDPIFAAAFGFKVDGTTYGTLSKYVRAFYGHAESAFLNSELDDNIKGVYRMASGLVLPPLRELDDNFNKQFLPSLKGQSGLGVVIDGKWKSKKWQSDMPDIKRELPMLEMGLLLGIKDGDKLAGAMKNFRTGLEKLVNGAAQATGQGGFFGQFKLEEPKKHVGKRGTLYSWQMPKEAGLDEQVVPTAAVGKEVATLALSKAHAERLLSRAPLKLDGGPLAAKRELVGGMVFNMAGLVDLVMAWADAAPELIPGGDDDVAKFIRKQALDIVRQVKQVGNVLKCVKQAQAASYLDGGKVVTHMRLTLRDLEDSPEPPGGK